jgi:hypothetical protein
MRSITKEIVKQVGTDVSGKWIATDKADTMIELTVAECILAVQNTGKQCAITTHDLGTVDCTIEKSVQSIKQHFNLNNDSK